MPLNSDEIHKRTDTIFRSISDQYNPNLKTFLLAGRVYEKALSGVSVASRHYFDAMTKLGLVACDSTSAKDLGQSMREVSETLRQIQLHYDDTVKFLSHEIIYPLENKLEHDTKYMLGVQKKYQSDFKLRTDDLDRMSMNHKKMKRKSYNGKKSYKYDEKEKQLAESVALKQKALDQFQHENLKQAFIEERRRYCFFVEQQCDLVKRNISYHQRATESLQAQLSKWVDSCAEIRSLPESASALLDMSKPEDSTSLYSIPDPPSEPPAQMNGFDHNYTSAMNTGTPATNRPVQESDPAPRPVNSTGHNVIPRESRKKVSAVYSHSVPGSPTQLSFEKGDIIILMIPQPRDGWHYGENDRTKQRGWFPYSYTKLLEQYNSPEKPQEPIHGHMALPPADYNSPPVQENGNWSSYPAPPQDHGPDPYKQMKDQFLLGNPFANVQLRKTESGDRMDGDEF